MASSSVIHLPFLVSPYHLPLLWYTPESVFTHTIPGCGGVCACVAPEDFFLALEVDPPELLDEDDAAAGAGVPAGAASAAGEAAAAGVGLASAPFFLRDFFAGALVLVSAADPAVGELVGCAAAGAVVVVPVPVSSPFFLRDFLVVGALLSAAAAGVRDAVAPASPFFFFFFFLVVVSSLF
jgi:hypothetical protein